MATVGLVVDHSSVDLEMGWSFLNQGGNIIWNSMTKQKLGKSAGGHNVFTSHTGRYWIILQPWASMSISYKLKSIVRLHHYWYIHRDYVFNCNHREQWPVLQLLNVPSRLKLSYYTLVPRNWTTIIKTFFQMQNKGFRFRHIYYKNGSKAQGSCTPSYSGSLTCRDFNKFWEIRFCSNRVCVHTTDAINICIPNPVAKNRDHRLARASQVWPNLKFAWTALVHGSVLPSESVIRKLRAPVILLRTVHNEPQLRYIGIQLVYEPLIFTDLMSPTPPTLEMRTIKK